MNDKKIVKAISSSVIEYLTKNKRLDLLQAVIDSLNNLLIDDVVVESARDLSQQEKLKVGKLIAEKVGLRNNIVYKTNQSLMDGLRIIYKDKLWDMSLVSQISKLNIK